MEISDSDWEQRKLEEFKLGLKPLSASEENVQIFSQSDLKSFSPMPENAILLLPTHESKPNHSKP